MSKNDKNKEFENSAEETSTFGQPPPKSMKLPPKKDVDEDDIATIDLREEGDWLHPSPDDEPSGYMPASEMSEDTRDRDLIAEYYEANDISRDIDTMTKAEIAREAKRIREKHQED